MPSVTNKALTMSVREMRLLLGIKKTDSYWLIHQQRFETIIVADRIRIVRASFEKWYANQDHYHKVTGEVPGQELRMTSYSIQDIADILGISHDSSLELVKRKGFSFWKDKLYFRVSRREFDEWYASQKRHRNSDDRKRDEVAERTSITIPDMGRELGLNRREAYKLANRCKQLEIIRVGDRPRVTIQSYNDWYNNQTQYFKKNGNCPSCVLVPLIIPSDKSTFGFKDAAILLQMDEYDLKQLIDQEKLVHVIIAGRNRITRDSMQSYADEHHLMIESREGL